MKRMKKIKGIKGFIGVSLIDYPGTIAAVLFTGGCNMSCSYCHNKELIFNPHKIPDITLEKIIDDLVDNRGLVDGVVITGGEPTIFPSLIPLIKELRRFGMKIKVDTNGLNPKVIHKLLSRKLVDYIAVDVKSSLDQYGLLGCKSGMEKNLVETISILKSQNKVDWELRTTFIDSFVNPKTFEGIRDLILGAKNYCIQASEYCSVMNAVRFADYVRLTCEIRNLKFKNFEGRMA
jgi:pyruvate formate lyase activating enzyme